jgi:hypothetical protein
VKPHPVERGALAGAANLISRRTLETGQLFIVPITVAPEGKTRNKVSVVLIYRIKILFAR